MVDDRFLYAGLIRLHVLHHAVMPVSIRYVVNDVGTAVES
jgi:hypothetical protein